jgi:hypothetical protein
MNEDLENLRSKGAELRLEMAGFVDGLAPWQVIAHQTFPWEASLDSTRRIYERFMRTRHRDVDYFYAIEQNPSRAGHHVHAVLHRSLRPYLKEWWAEWFEKYGRCRFEFIKDRADVVNYAAKYVSKQDTWWNFHLVRTPGFVTENGLVLGGEVK